MSNVPLEPTAHETNAGAALTTLRSLFGGIVGFAHIAKERRQKINPMAVLPDDFMHAVGVGCDASPHLSTSAQLTLAEVRDVLGYSSAYTAVADELELIARALRGSIAERRADVGRRCLNAYNLAGRMNVPGEREVLVPHLTTMRVALGRAGVKRKKKEDPKDKRSPVITEPPPATRSIDPSIEFKAGKDL